MRTYRFPALVLAGLMFGALAHALEPLETRPATDWFGPQPMDRVEAGIGRQIQNMALEQLAGGPVALQDSGGERGTVIFIRDPECPVSTVYGPRLARFARIYHPQGFNFLALYMNDQLDPSLLAADSSGFDGPVLFIRGEEGTLAKALGVQSTGDVFILDAQQRLVYRGAVDDQYGIGYTREIATNKLLEHALDALIEGRPIQVPATTAPGCYIDTDPLSEPELVPWTPEEQQS